MASQVQGARIILFPGVRKRPNAVRHTRPRDGSRKVKISGMPDGVVRIEGTPRKRRIKASQVDVFIGEASSGVHVSLHQNSDSGAWIAVVSQMDAASPVAWPVMVMHEQPNSASLFIECSATAPIAWEVTEP